VVYGAPGRAPLLVGLARRAPCRLVRKRRQRAPPARAPLVKPCRAEPGQGRRSRRSADVGVGRDQAHAGQAAPFFAGGHMQAEDLLPTTRAAPRGPSAPARRRRRRRCTGRRPVGRGAERLDRASSWGAPSSSPCQSAAMDWRVRHCGGATTVMLTPRHRGVGCACGQMRPQRPSGVM
jgi:hypothetical protein